MYPDALVIPEETGQDRNYRSYPYGDYRTNHEYMAYPVAYEDDRILTKERVHGIIINNEVKVYQSSNF